MSILISLLIYVSAEPVVPPRFLPSSYQLQKHGPDGPPPDGGYQIKDDGGENSLGKLGVLCLAGSAVSSILMLASPEESEDKEKYGNIALGLAGGGVGFLVLERVF